VSSRPDVTSNALHTAALPERARSLLRDALVWDAHSGFSPSPKTDLNELSRWEKANVDYLSINVGFDGYPWMETIRTLAAFRHWLELRPDRFILVDKAADVLRAKKEGKMGITFDLEGAVTLGGQIEMVALYHRLGVRQMHFVYNINNEAGGGCHDDDQGLTDFGREIVKEANRLGVLIDLSHVGYRTSLEVCERSQKPVVYSHSNPKDVADHPRNITEEQMRACISTGGLIGVSGVGRMIGDLSASSKHYARAIDMTVERVGIKNVGIGLDHTWEVFDDVGTPSKFWPMEHYQQSSKFVNPGQLPEITELLLKLGYGDEDIRDVFGANYLRVVERVWR